MRDLHQLQPTSHELRYLARLGSSLVCGTAPGTTGRGSYFFLGVSQSSRNAHRSHRLIFVTSTPGYSIDETMRCPRAYSFPQMAMRL